MKHMTKLCFLLGVMFCGVSFGAPFLGNQIWTGSDTGGWSNSTFSSVAGTNGSLQLTIDDSGNPEAYFYASSTGGGAATNFTGNYSQVVSNLNASLNNLVVRFSLTSVTNPNQAGGAMALYFARGANYYTLNQPFTQPSFGITSNYSATISSTGWSLQQGSDNFAADFADVTQFGLYLVGSSDIGTHIYDLNNFQLTSESSVPEPETVWMILMVLASLGLTFRSRLLELAGQVKARIRA